MENNKYLGWNEISDALLQVYGIGRILNALRHARAGEKLREVSMFDAELPVIKEINRAFAEQSDDAKQFIDNLDWMANALERHSDEDLLALFRMRDKITDGDVRRRLLRSLASYTENIKNKVMFGRALAADPDATLNEMVRFYYPVSEYLKSKISDAERAKLLNEIRDLNNDVIRRGQAEIDEILSSERPNVDKLREITDFVRASMENTAGLVRSPENTKMTEMVNRKFNVASILAADAPSQYMAQYDNTLESELIDARNQVKSGMDAVKSRDDRIAQLERQLADANAQLAAARTQINDLNQKNDALRESDKNNRNEMNNTLRRLKDAAAKMSAGMGSKGVNQFKELIERTAQNEY